MFDKKTQEYLDKIVSIRHLKSADITAEPKYYLTHNKECAEFRQRVMENVDDFTRGHLFGTACICNGTEDKILDKIEIKIGRYYTRENMEVMTEQHGVCSASEALPRIEKVYRHAKKVKAVKKASFGDEIIVEVSQGY